MRRALLVVLVAVFITACGSGGPSISTSASKLLSAEVGLARDAAARGDYAAALADLGQLDSYATTLHDRHQIDDRRAAAIHADAAQVRTAIAALSTTTTSPSTTTPTVTTPPSSPAPKHNRHGHGHGQSGDNGD